MNSAKQSETRPVAERPKNIQACNFRSAGRLSNENARSLTAIHESFARELASALDVLMGIGVEVKLLALDQLPVKEHIAKLPPLNYILPFTFRSMPGAVSSAVPGAVIVECDLDLVFPIIEVLLGGAGTSQTEPRELSEIEEEIMQDVTAIIARHAEHAWHMPPMTLVGNRRIKSSLLYQYCPSNEKVTLVRFQVELAGRIGAFQLTFPTSFLNVLLKQIKLEQPQRKGGLRYFPTRSMRERVLDCDFDLSAGLPRLRVSVKDLVTLEPGSVLKFRTPVRAPGMLSVAGMDLFEITPVRNGLKKAAQIGRQTRLTDWGME
ncbi:MAG: flagellar motor switch protein FliM [Acidobacteriaceae bacterium]